MPDPSRLRDSTQIVLPCGALDGMEDHIENQFTVTVFRDHDHCRIIGSPVEIKAVGEYLTRQGITLR
ncbi:hypothetical protein AArcSl_2173 [Halalkaliarchaeum desulfuricum]|uniref:Uncharacterized protein n=1 Tax=Halalkaliarchaeum desulfuricum TaxID=2055893 RepID=A0A343TL26_9EURY|nr:hypothetical protein [Halalkaliarchaeum desulfuricum]AUX09798.1 hypothetical protein AArcSl_2173 [Halalkaliarchaeum desulfuricum]